MLKRIVSVILAAIMIAILVACGSSSSGGASDSTQDNSAAQESAETTKAAAEEKTEAEVISVDDENVSAQIEQINVGITGDITNFFPWQSRGSGGWESAIAGIYQTLLSYYPQEDAYYPCIMKSYSLADDGMSMDGEIFDYIHDSEGHHITMDDVLFSFEKTYETFGDVRDMAEGMEKTGDYTFTLKFNRPLRLGEFLYLTNWSIVSKEAFEDSVDEMQLTPVGTGPYKLVEHEEGYSFTYEKVEDYWQTDPEYDNPRDRANVNTIKWYVISESSQRTIALEQGTIDICSAIDNVDLDKFDGKNGKHLYTYSHVLNMTLFPNCDASSPTSDLNLRLAIGYAINNEAILQSVYGGIGSVMYDAGPSWSVNYNKAWDDEDNYYHYNPETAKEYLAQSGYNNETLRIICKSDAESVNTAQLVQNLLLQVGINTSIDSYENSTFNDYIKDPSLWDIMIATNATGNSNYLSAIEGPMNPEAYSWGGTKNFIFDDELTEILDKALQGDATADDVEALHEYMIANCYMMGLVNTTTVVVLPDEVTGVVRSIRNTIMPGACTYSE